MPPTNKPPPPPADLPTASSSSDSEVQKPTSQPQISLNIRLCQPRRSTRLHHQSRSIRLCQPRLTPPLQMEEETSSEVADDEDIEDQEAQPSPPPQLEEEETSSEETEDEDEEDQDAQPSPRMEEEETSSEGTENEDKEDEDAQPSPPLEEEETSSEETEDEDEEEQEAQPSHTFKSDFKIHPPSPNPKSDSESGSDSDSEPDASALPSNPKVTPKSKAQSSAAASSRLASKRHADYNGHVSETKRAKKKSEPMLVTMDSKESEKIDDEFVNIGLAMSSIIPFGKGLRIDEDVLKKGMELIDVSKKAELEGKWKKLQEAEMELFMNRADLVAEQAKLIIQAYWSPKNWKKNWDCQV